MQAIPENISIRMLNGMLKRLVTATLSAALHPGRLPVGGCIAVGGDIKIIKSVSIGPANIDHRGTPMINICRPMFSNKWTPTTQKFKLCSGVQRNGF